MGVLANRLNRHLLYNDIFKMIGCEFNTLQY